MCVCIRGGSVSSDHLPKNRFLHRTLAKRFMAALRDTTSTSTKSFLPTLDGEKAKTWDFGHEKIWISGRFRRTLAC